MKVSGKEVIMLPLEILNVNVYCPHDFLSGSAIKEVERYFRGVSSAKCESNLDCEDCWRECADRINTIYGTTPAFIKKKKKEAMKMRKIKNLSILRRYVMKKAKIV